MREHAVGFDLTSSNDLGKLAARLAATLAKPRADDSLRADTILVPHPTMRRWLQRELALRLGVAANLDFATPSEFVWRLLRAQSPQLPKQSPWNPERLRWCLFRLLGDDRLPPAVAEHLQRSPGPLARWRLAEALAAAFDRYQAYRRELLEAWERGEDANDWQAELWRRLRRDPVPPRSRLIGDWLRRFGDAHEAPPGLPPWLCAFGTIHMSPDALRMLGVAARHCALDFHLPSPCREYWGDVESLRATLKRDGVDALPAALAAAQHDNPLLQAWGAAGRDFIAQLYSYELAQPDRERDAFAEPGRNTLLRAMRADVLDRAAPRTLAVFADDDASIQVHACHSKLREVEVLHDRLRALLDDDETLRPEDIAVLAPDIGDYLPLVRAVFGIAADDRRYIPFTLSDRPQAQAHPLVGLFLSLLELPASRRTQSEVRDLLAVPAVMAALQLQESDLERIGAWLSASGVRWGDDESAREALGFGRWREHSFGFGLDRLLIGYASGDEALVAGVAPCADIEGAAAERLGAVVELLQRLCELDAFLRLPHAATEWRQRLARDFLALLPEVPLDEAEQQARRIVLETLDAFVNEAVDAGELPCEVVASALRDALQSPSPHQPFLGAGVTFAGMVPLRTMPFRVICLLGMDADAFPRREPGGDINRIAGELQAGKRKLGDRSVREDDRFLFLQLLCAAGDVFYLSHGGRDARDGSVRDASALVSELLDVAQRYLPTGIDARERLVLEHPLQPFSPRAFGRVGDPDDARRFSYRREWRPAADASGIAAPAPFFEQAMPETDGDADEIPDLRILRRFLRNPARAFLQGRLGLRLPHAGRNEDREPLGDDRLLRHRRIALLLDGDLDEVELRARGLLPPGLGANAAASEARAAAAMVANEADAWLAAGEGANRRALRLAGGLKGKYRLDALFEHLALAQAHGEAAQTRVFGLEKIKGEDALQVVGEELPSLSVEAARAWREDLATLWREGRSRPLPFAPDAAWTYIEALRKKPDAQAAFATAIRIFDGEFGEARDPWFALAFRPRGMLAAFDDAQGRKFRELAERVFLGPTRGSA